jgi:plastocyanin
MLSTLILAGDGHAQSTARAHTIFMTAVEVKGATITQKLAPPPVDPANLSKGYGFRAPGEADPKAPQHWEVSSYLLLPGFVAVQRGDTVTLVVFVVNGDEHEVRVLAPDGKVVAPKTTLNRGREYRLTFVAEQAGTYHLSCSTHAPTMTASILVLPR